MVAEVLSVVDDTSQHVFFFWLERQYLDFVLPLNEVFKLGPSGVARNLDAPVTYWTSVFLIFFYLATRDFETFAVIPVIVSNLNFPNRGWISPFMA